MKKIFDLARRFKAPSLKAIVFWGAALILSLGLFAAVRSFVACWRLTSLPGIPLPGCPGPAVNPLGTPVLNPQGTPVAASAPTPARPPEITYPQWDGGSRVNVLFIGLDYRDWLANEGPPRSDTMILFTIDPITKSAGMLSIPRDLWVNIPGFNYGPINTAYALGEANKLPGGGPGLAMKTVSQFIGVPLQYYAQVDFNTFVAFINTIDGIDVYVEEDLVLDPLGTGLDHVKVTCCGIRHLDGARALAYARTRKTQGGDVDRARRQQQVIFAIRDKVLSPEYFPDLFAKAPQLYGMFSAGIHTNMSLEDAIKLAVLARDIPPQRIKSGVIDYSMGILGNVLLNGQNKSILKPIPDKIRVLRDEIFTSGGPTSPIARGQPAELMKSEGARLRVTNNTYTPQLEARTGNYLLSQGFNVTELGRPTGLANQTVLVLYSPKLYTLRYLISLFGISSSSQIIIKPDPASTVEVEVRLGNDWVSKLPAGY